jgi:hypothetical protein
MDPDELEGLTPAELQTYFEGMIANPLSPDERGRLYDALREGEATQGRKLSPELAEGFLDYAAMVRAEYARLKAAISGMATFERIGDAWGFRWKS